MRDLLAAIMRPARQKAALIEPNLDAVFTVLHHMCRSGVFIMVTVLTQAVRVKEDRGDITCKTRRETREEETHTLTRGQT